MQLSHSLRKFTNLYSPFLHSYITIKLFPEDGHAMPMIFLDVFPSNHYGIIIQRPKTEKATLRVGFSVFYLHICNIFCIFAAVINSQAFYDYFYHCIDPFGRWFFDLRRIG